ncbi:pimeloyl-ACP methyl ester carboxylesterase [Prauserella shujinwangii]|uniref:Pimeloyl-ACP methyl ester carboxylesterase n=1 Tax=Prauserella shujinwangii TaxID=1453103 RepID=A0A2T0LKJ0_9PSEU|nr:alpha/beta fold hydrolase [Prauserella shujinwangii]PRX43419.1 pimeloyl-ACP methyl ester carboxylesterase [Prauserella shujinwangii]
MEAELRDDELRAWRASGTTLETPWGTVFTRHRRGAGTDPALLLLHGYPTSSYDWHAVLPLLGDRTVVTLDFLGFGLSAKPRRHRYTLFEQANIVEYVAGEYLDGSVTVVAHDMGTSVATELMARDCEHALDFRLDRVILSNGSVLLDRASLRPVQRLLRSPAGPLVAALGNRRVFRRQLAAVYSPAHPLDPADADRHWQLLAAGDGHRVLHRLAGYLGERVRYAPRWHGAVREWPGPLGLLWGLRDPVATTSVLDGLRELRPEAGVVVLPEAGHYPQLEDPVGYVRGLADLW